MGKIVKSAGAETIMHRLWTSIPPLTSQRQTRPCARQGISRFMSVKCTRIVCREPADAKWLDAMWAPRLLDCDGGMKVGVLSHTAGTLP